METQSAKRCGFFERATKQLRKGGNKSGRGSERIPDEMKERKCRRIKGKRGRKWREEKVRKGER